jgi:hypothetical protein
MLYSMCCVQETEDKMYVPINTCGKRIQESLIRFKQIIPFPLLFPLQLHELIRIIAKFDKVT